MFGFLLNVLNLTVSFVFPLVATHRALQTTDVSALKPWVVYWLVVGLLTAAEHQLYFVLKYVPFYSLARLYVSVWLVLPQTKGADFVYHGYVAPFIANHEHEIDAIMRNACNPVELTTVIASYFGYDLKQTRLGFARGLSSTTADSQKKSVVDSFIENFQKDGVVSTNNGAKGLMESLLGVVGTLPIAKGAVSSSSSQYTQTTHPNGNAVSETSSNDGDFDVVAKEDFEHYNQGVPSSSEVSTPLKPELSKTRSTGWFSTWYWGSKEEKPKVE